MNTWSVVDVWRGAPWNPIAGISLEKEVEPGVWHLKRFGMTPDRADIESSANTTLCERSVA